MEGFIFYNSNWNPDLNLPGDFIVVESSGANSGHIFRNSSLIGQLATLKIPMDHKDNEMFSKILVKAINMVQFLHKISQQFLYTWRFADFKIRFGPYTNLRHVMNWGVM